MNNAAHTDQGSMTKSSDQSDADRTVAAAPTARAAPADEPTSASVPRPGPDPLEFVDAGQQLDEFDLLTSLGSGAFARVFLARQRSMQRLVAVKVSADEGTEPQTLAQLDHDNIVRVFDQRRIEHPVRAIRASAATGNVTGASAATGNSTGASAAGTTAGSVQLKLLYMQYVPGGTLHGVLQRVRAAPAAQRSGRLLLDAVDDVLTQRGENRPGGSATRREIAGLTWPQTVAWLGRRLADALDYADRRGILHRDVKPANVLLTAEGIPKLADFNISYARNLEQASPIEYFGGSLSYMSPEHLAACHPGKTDSAKDLDTRSDNYSLGIVLWELLTGTKPFTDERIGGDTTTLDAMIDVRHHGLSEDALATLPVNTPPTLRRVLVGCLDPQPGKRWRSGSELAQQLDLCLDAHASALVDPPPDSWRIRLRPWSILIMELGVVVPNLLAAYFYYTVVKTLVVQRYAPTQTGTWDRVWLGLTAASFAISGLVMLYRRRYLVIVPHGLRRGRSYDEPTMARARTDAVLLGDRVIQVLAASWIGWGVVLGIVVAATIDGIPVRGYATIAGTVAVCAAIAIAYPFFLATLYAIRSLYPTFLPHGEVSDADARRLRRLRARSRAYLAVAAAVPLCGVLLATLVTPDELWSVIVPIRILCVGGIVAFVGVYWVYRMLEDDLDALSRVTSNDPSAISVP